VDPKTDEMEGLPFISILMPIYNEEDNLLHSLQGLAEQTYPNNCFEVLIADAGSTDKSLKVIEGYKSKLNIVVLDNSDKRQAEWGKALAFSKAKGKYVQTVDADVYPNSPMLLEKLVFVMEQNNNLTGIFARYFSSKQQSIWNRYLSCDPLQYDPLFQVLKKPINNYVVAGFDDYDLMKFYGNDVPAIGQTTMFRKEDVDLNRWGGRWSEIDLVAYLASIGKNEFGYLKSHGWHHDHCKSLKELSRKRRRNVAVTEHGYLHNFEHREFVWLDFTDNLLKLKLIVHVVSANLIFPSLIMGIYYSIKNRKLNQLLRPIIDLVVTDTLLVTFLSRKSGWSFLRLFIKSSK